MAKASNPTTAVKNATTAPALDIAEPLIISFLLNNAPDATQNTLNVSLVGALNTIVIDGINFDAAKAQFSVVCPGLSLFDFEPVNREAKKIWGTFRASEATFPGVTYDIFAFVANTIVGQAGSATIEVVPF